MKSVVPFFALSAALAGCCRNCNVEVVRADDETPAAYLERLRETAADVRARCPGVKIGGCADAGLDDFTKTFVGFGEAEEIDFWRVKGGADGDADALRKLFDSAGGKAVEIRGADGVISASPCDFAKFGSFKGEPPKSLLVAASGRVFAVGPDGKPTFEKRGCGNVHRAQTRGDWVYYSNGDLWRVRRATPKGLEPFGEKPRLVYRASERAGAAVLGFDVLANGNVVLALNASSEVVELNADFREIVRFKVDCRDAKGATPPPHGRLRFVRKTAKGTYLVCCASAACVREYDAKGKLVWEQSAPPFVFDALRRANGNTLVSHLTGVTEFSPDHKAVWSFACSDAPELKLNMLCGVQEMPNGEIVVGTWANGAKDGSAAVAAQIGRDGKVRWAWFATGDVNAMSARVGD